MYVLTLSFSIQKGNNNLRQLFFFLVFVNFYKETLPIIIQREQHSKEIAIEGHQVNYGCAGMYNTCLNIK